MVLLKTRELSPATAPGVGGMPVYVLAVGRPMARVSPGLTILDTLREAGIGPPTAQQILRVVNGKVSEEVKDPTRTLLPGEKVTLTNRVAGG